MSFGFMHRRPFLEENVNITPKMEEGEFHLGIPSREEVNKEQKVYKPGHTERSLNQSLKGFPFWPRLYKHK